MFERARRTAQLLAAILALALPFPATSAQGFRIVQSAPDCRLLRPAFDNPFSDAKGYVQPRLAWHAEYAIGALALGYALHRATRLPAWASAALVTVGLGVVPHVRSVLIQRRYALNPGDLAFDVWDRSTPMFWAIGHHDDSTDVQWRHAMAMAGLWSVGYAATACFASP